MSKGRGGTADKGLAAAGMDEGSRLKALVPPLLAWYEEHGRPLPWREDPQPYRVWISEIMLQQTRIEAVKPYYDRFIRELPDVAALAAVEDDRLMKLWEGLGYYNRARNLKKAAVVVEREYGGRLPGEYRELVKLPGIGNYTAGAIASISYGQAVPAVDGNVLRVVSRVLASREDIRKQSTKKRVEALLAEAMPERDAGSFNQGLMEVGETLCIPNGHPLCGGCPFHPLCLASLRGQTDQIPVKAPPPKRRVEERTVCVLERDGYIGLRKREDKGLLASLYELPNAEGHLAPEELAETFHLNREAIFSLERLPDAKHIFSHVEWHMAGYRVRLARAMPEGYIAARKEDLKTIYPLPNAFGRYIKLIN